MTLGMRRYLPVMTFLSVVLASLAMAGFAYFTTQDAMRVKFEAKADDVLNRFENRLESYLSLLNASHAFFSAQEGKVSGAAFKIFFDTINFDRKFTGLEAIGFASLIKRGDEAATEMLIARNYGRKLLIHPESDQLWRVPVVLFEPVDQTSGIGYDMYTDPECRTAITNAMANDGRWTTGAVALGQSGGERKMTGFLVFRRFHIQSASGNDAAPQDRPLGFLFVTFKPWEFFNSMQNHQAAPPLAVTVFDGVPESGNLLYRSQNWNLSSDEQTVFRTIVAGGRQWTILFQRPPAFKPAASLAIPSILGFFSLLLATALALVVKLQSKAYDAAQALQLQAEKSLLEKDLLLQEMMHRVKNSISRMLAIARQSSINATDIKEFTDSFTARLQAMAASQNVLSQARRQKADLLDLARIELAQAFGDKLSANAIDGQSLYLDEAATRALGLTFHELATNTLKYGNISGLKVAWEVIGEERERKLWLRWEETGLKGLVSPEKIGFGTRLIDMSIERELGGTIRREFNESRLVVDIKIPWKNRQTAKN